MFCSVSQIPGAQGNSTRGATKEFKLQKAAWQHNLDPSKTLIKSANDYKR